jgi:hypothetical protein
VDESVVYTIAAMGYCHPILPGRAAFVKSLARARALHRPNVAAITKRLLACATHALVALKISSSVVRFHYASGKCVEKPEASDDSQADKRNKTDP